MIRILVLKRLHNLSDERVEFQLLDRISFQGFCGLTMVANFPDRTMMWNFETRIRASGGAALFEGLNAQLLKQGCLARGGQIIDATLVPASKMDVIREERELIDEKDTPTRSEAAKRGQKNIESTRTKTHGKSYFSYKLSVNTDRRYKPIRKLETDTSSVHNGQHFEAVFDRTNTSSDAYADRGYPSQARESDLKVRGHRPKIQRKGTSKRMPPECQ
jgi:IS5 family transposase